MLNPAAMVPLREAAMGLMEFLGSDYGPEFKGESERRYGAACRTMLTALTLADSPSPVGEVKRWEMVFGSAGPGIETDTNGRFVKFTDYAALSAELAEVRGVLEAAKAFVYRSSRFEPDNNFQRELKQAVDAALARAATVKGKP